MQCTYTFNIIGKEYVCVLRLHSAIENETQLAKVNKARGTTLMFTNVTKASVCLDAGPDGWGTLPATSINLSCKTPTQSPDNLREQATGV